MIRCFMNINIGQFKLLKWSISIFRRLTRTVYYTTRTPRKNTKNSRRRKLCSPPIFFDDYLVNVLTFKRLPWNIWCVTDFDETDSSFFFKFLKTFRSSDDFETLLTCVVILPTGDEIADKRPSLIQWFRRTLFLEFAWPTKRVAGTT